MVQQGMMPEQYVHHYADPPTKDAVNKMMLEFDEFLNKHRDLRKNRVEYETLYPNPPEPKIREKERWDREQRMKKLLSGIREEGEGEGSASHQQPLQITAGGEDEGAGTSSSSRAVPAIEQG